MREVARKVARKATRDMKVAREMKLIRGRNLKDVHITGAMSGAECSS